MAIHRLYTIIYKVITIVNIIEMKYMVLIKVINAYSYTKIQKRRAIGLFLKGGYFMKIVNKKRFIVFVVLMISIGIRVTSIAINAMESNISRTSELTEKELSYLEKFDQVEIRILEGDTSWNIQRELSPNFDVRKLLYYAGKINDRSMGSIRTGESLIFLKEKAE